jgi:hypothetical protein
LVHFVVGMFLVGLGIWGIIAWWSVFGFVMRGVIPFLLLFLGLIAIIASCRRTEEDRGEPRPQPEPEPEPEPEDDLLDPVGDVFGGGARGPSRAS